MAESNTATSLDRGLRIIEYLCDTKEPQSLKAISKNLQIPSTSTFRIIKNLVDRGYLIEQNVGCLVYSMGNRIAELAYHYNKNISLNAISLPIMERLSKSTGQTSQLAIMNGNQFIYVEQVLPTVPVSVVAPLHTPIALNYSAGAKIILANKPISFQTSYLANCRFDRKTKNTIIEVEKLLDELSRAKVGGYAVDNEEFSMGVGCIAAPIYNYNLECVAAIGVTGQIESYRDAETFNRFLVEVKMAANEISRNLGYHEK